MSKSLLPLMAVAVLGVAACESTLPPGHYEHKSTSTSRDGTKTTVNKETDVYYDQYGNKKTTVQTEKTTDPKGLFNKTKTESVETTND